MCLQNLEEQALQSEVAKKFTKMANISSSSSASTLFSVLVIICFIFSVANVPTSLGRSEQKKSTIAAPLISNVQTDNTCLTHIVSNLPKTYNNTVVDVVLYVNKKTGTTVVQVQRVGREVDARMNVLIVNAMKDVADINMHVNAIIFAHVTDCDAVYESLKETILLYNVPKSELERFILCDYQ